MTTSKEKLAILIRVSSEKQKDQGHSLEYQLKLGIKKAEELGLEFEVYDEKNVSSTSNSIEHRPELKRLVDNIKAGEIKHIFSYELSRFTRNEETQVYLRVLFAKHDVKVYTSSGNFDMSNQNDYLFAAIKGLFEVEEKKTFSSRSKRGLEECAERGGWIGRMIPYGYLKLGLKKEQKIVPYEEEVKIYQQMVDWSIAGMGAFKIAKKLNQLNIPTKGSKVLLNGIKIRNKYTQEERSVASSELTWAPNTVLNILKNSLYKGERKYKNKVFKFTPIISAEKWELLNRNLTKNKSNSERNNKIHFYLLKGLLRCAKCGRNLYGYVKEAPGKNQRSYICSSKREIACGLKSINIDRLNELIWSIVTDSNYFLRQLVKEMTTPLNDLHIVELELNFESIQNEVKTIEAKKERNLDLYRDGRISLEKCNNKDDEYKVRAEQLDTKLNSIKNEINSIKSTKDVKSSLIERISLVAGKVQSYTNEEKRSFVISIVKNIIVNYDEETQDHSLRIELNYSSHQIPINISSKGKSNYRSNNLKFYTMNQDSKEMVKLEFNRPVKPLPLNVSHLPPPIVTVLNPLHYHNTGVLKLPILLVFAKMPVFKPQYDLEAIEFQY